jgi:AraC family transcriptional regulator, ethanolamine operon transcriptional activator
MNVEHTASIEESKLVSLVNSSLTWAQLERGTLDVAYRVLAVPPLVVSTRTVNLACQVRANLEPGRVITGIVESPRAGALWLGHQVDSEMLAVGRTELDIRTTGPSTVLGIAVDQNQLQSRFPDSLDASDVMEGLGRDGAVRNASATTRIRKAIHSICANPARPPQSITGTLIPLLAETLKTLDRYSVERSECSKRRFAAVRACERYMRENLTASVTILDLSRFSGMRARSLINAFEAITGLSPMDYLKRLRLSEVRRALLRADRRRTRVINVAMDWGFWHMGHFARDYRAMFGEAPSQTLLA